ncbi:hypothetical protein [Xanthomonas medicagonis]|uniref:hypothetical protein n=1 Tax=Xanthomonas medicagonis TaxID=3160841 RepID=UPI003510E890
MGLAILVAGCIAACNGAPRHKERAIDEEAVRQIVLHYEYRGWATVNEDFVIQRRPNGDFGMTGRIASGGQPPRTVDVAVRKSDLRRFLDEAAAPAWSRREGIGDVAKRVGVRRLLSFEPVSRLPPSACDDSAILAAARSMVARQGVEGIVDAYYGDGMRWTDDYPFVVVQILFRDAEPLVISSDSQMALMLPWHVGVPDRRARAQAPQNWSVPLTRSVQALLPPESKLYQRVGGIEQMRSRLRGDLEIAAERSCSAAKENAQQRGVR